MCRPRDDDGSMTISGVTDVTLQTDRTRHASAIRPNRGRESQLRLVPDLRPAFVCAVCRVGAVGGSVGVVHIPFRVGGWWRGVVWFMVTVAVGTHNRDSVEVARDVTVTGREGVTCTRDGREQSE
jgi:hypothetical protein